MVGVPACAEAATRDQRHVDAEPEPKQVWLASPDWESAAAVWVPHTTVTLPGGGVAVNFTVPQLHYWTVAVLE